ncbi:MAG: hypothetical protein KDD69_19870, partial [Bdellovibrionales bacterium]|nr:hypothetical protein [Bdellovibrionales bacterium]
LFDVPPPPTYQPGTHTVDNVLFLPNTQDAPLGGETANVDISLTSDPDEGYAGVLLLKTKVSDDKVADSLVYPLYVTNTAPELAELEHIAISWRRDSITIPLSASDADGDPIEFRAFLGWHDAQVKDLSERFAFGPHPDGFRQNERGWREKWLLGSVDGSRVEFVILPNGALYRWNGSFASSELIARLDPAWHHSPEQLWNPRSVTLPEGVELALQGNAVFVNPPDGVLMSIPITVQVTDGNAWDEQLFYVNVVNLPPVIDEVEDQLIHWRAEPASSELSGYDPDGDPVTFSVDWYDHSQAYWLDQQYDFRLETTTYRQNALGLQERSFQGKDKSARYIVLPDGRLYSWKGTLDKSMLLAILPQVYYRQPKLLFDVLPPFTEAPAGVTLDVQTATIQMTSGFTGYLLVEASITDGHAWDRTVYLVEVYDRAPAIAALEDQFYSYRTDQVEIDLAPADADAQDRPGEHTSFFGSAGHVYRELDQQYDFGPAPGGESFNRYGWGEKWVRGTVAGQVKDFAILPSGALYLWNGSFAASTPLAYLPAAIHQEPSYLFNAPPADALPEGVTLELDQERAFINPPVGWQGAIPFTGRVFDGNRATYQTVYLTFGNQPPVLNEIAPQRVHWKSAEAVVSLNAADPDGDPLTFSAAPVLEVGGPLEHPATLVVESGRLTVRVP